MAEADFTELTTTALGSGDVVKGVSAAFARPNGGGTHVHGFRSLTSAAGVAGWYYSASANFTPIAGSRKGGTISAAIKRYGSSEGFAPMIGLLRGTDPALTGYFLGLTQATSFKLALKKGTMSSGLATDDSGILRSSSLSYTDVGNGAAAWFHVRLDVIVEPHGETRLAVYKNDLTANAVTAPVWAAVAGMDDYIDDSLGQMSGSLPYLEGFYLVFGHYTSNDAGGVSLFDHIVAARQLTP